MPLISLASLLIGAYLILSSSIITIALWFVVRFRCITLWGIITLLFFEIGIGAYLDGRNQVQWLAPLLIFSFLFNMPICAKALLSLIIYKATGRRSHWVKLNTAETQYAIPRINSNSSELNFIIRNYDNVFNQYYFARNSGGNNCFLASIHRTKKTPRRRSPICLLLSKDRAFSLQT